MPSLAVHSAESRREDVGDENSEIAAEIHDGVTLGRLGVLTVPLLEHLLREFDAGLLFRQLIEEQT